MGFRKAGARKEGWRKVIVLFSRDLNDEYGNSSVPNMEIVPVFLLHGNSVNIALNLEWKFRCLPPIEKNSTTVTKNIHVKNRKTTSTT